MVKFFAVLFMLLWPLHAFGESPLRVAVASNFLAPTKTLAQSFESIHGQPVAIVSGSTGKLYAQIVHGAPFDVFLAADLRRPQLLVDQGHATPGSLFVYASGRLALWSADPDRVQGDSRALETNTFEHLAIANPKTAPYGKASQDVLKHLDLWKSLRTKMVRGENIGQTFQFVASGNAELGFIALSQIFRGPFQKKGSRWIVPAKLHSPIDQGAVRIKRKTEHPLAKAFTDFLKSATALTIIQSYGYGTGE